MNSEESFGLADDNTNTAENPDMPGEDLAQADASNTEPNPTTEYVNTLISFEHLVVGLTIENARSSADIPNPCTCLVLDGIHGDDSPCPLANNGEGGWAREVHDPEIPIDKASFRADATISRLFNYLPPHQ